MDERDTEYLRKGPVPDVADDVAHELGEVMREFANKVRSICDDPDAHVAMVTVLKFQSKADEAPGTIIAGLPNNVAVTGMLLLHAAKAYSEIAEDPRER